MAQRAEKVEREAAVPQEQRRAEAVKSREQQMAGQGFRTAPKRKAEPKREAAVEAHSGYPGAGPSTSSDR